MYIWLFYNAPNNGTTPSHHLHIRTNTRFTTCVTLPYSTGLLGPGLTPDLPQPFRAPLCPVRSVFHFPFNASGPCSLLKHVLSPTMRHYRVQLRPHHNKPTQKDCFPSTRRYTTIHRVDPFRHVYRSAVSLPPPPAVRPIVSLPGFVYNF